MMQAAYDEVGENVMTDEIREAAGKIERKAGLYSFDPRGGCNFVKIHCIQYAKLDRLATG